MEQTRIDLLAADPWTRLWAAEALDPATPEARYALRAALLADGDARVRGQAAATLGQAPPEEAVAGWLAEALSDPMPSVREACLRALSRQRATAAVPQCARLVTADPIWWVRRSAVLTVAALARTAAIATLRSALGDPFWRVRHAAVQALALLAEAHPAERERILSLEPLMPGDPAARPMAAASLWYLRAHFDASVEVHKFRVHAADGRPDDPLWNADPAVITARLRARPDADLDLHELVGLLGDPHEPLRSLAAKRLHARADLAVLRGALRHLEVPGMPHALATTWALLDGLGDRALALATEVLADRQAAAGALVWAASWTVRAGCEELYDSLAGQAQHRDPRARAAVARALAQLVPCRIAALVPLLSDPDESVRAAAALGLCRSDEEQAVRALQQGSAQGLPPSVRAALVGAAARRRDLFALHQAAGDPHPQPRAAALAELAHLGALHDAEASLPDPDPWVRAAVLRATPKAWLTVLASDPDPGVRRRALQLALADRQSLPAGERSALAHAAAQSLDAEQRAAGCALFAPAQEADLLALLDLTRDRSQAVRAAATEVLDGLADGDRRLRELLAQREVLSDGQRAAAYARLFRQLKGPAATALVETLALPGLEQREPALVCAQLRATALLLPDELYQSLPTAERAAIAALPTASGRARRQQRAAAPAPRQPLGRTGILVSPLVLSGAQELPSSALWQGWQAGVNTFFWEPGYIQLTRFLRDRDDRRELVIIAGTYEGDRAGIERDVQRALRRLRTEYLDVFLLFWTRSAQRLSAEAIATLRGLKQAGLIRAFGFSTHDRGLAESAIVTGDWDVVMTRHSAAHPGAEERLLPLARVHGVGVLAFSALCYTRLLRAPAPRDALATEAALPTAAECYGYCLSQPAVSACLSAPRNHRELRENLSVLTHAGEDAPRLSAQRQQELRAFGRIVREQNQRFDALLRKGQTGSQEAPPQQRAAELLEQLLDSAPAPELEVQQSLEAPAPSTSPRRARRRRAPRSGTGFAQ